MTFFTVPLGNTLPWYKFTITLSGTIFTLSPRFNGRMNNWMMDILDPAGNEILASIPLLINRDLTGQYPTLPLPVGVLFVTDATKQGQNPGQYSFGTTNVCWYGDPTQ